MLLVLLSVFSQSFGPDSIELRGEPFEKSEISPRTYWEHTFPCVTTVKAVQKIVSSQSSFMGK